MGRREQSDVDDVIGFHFFLGCASEVLAYNDGKIHKYFGSMRGVVLNFCGRYSCQHGNCNGAMIGWSLCSEDQTEIKRGTAEWFHASKR